MAKHNRNMTFRPLPERCVLADKGPTEEGGGSGGGRGADEGQAKGKGQKQRVQKISPWWSGGWEEPGRSPEAIQRPARMVAHGGVDGGRSHGGGKGPTTPGGRLTETELLEVETQVEQSRRRARVTSRIRRA